MLHRLPCFRQHNGRSGGAETAGYRDKLIPIAGAILALQVGWRPLERRRNFETKQPFRLVKILSYTYMTLNKQFRHVRQVYFPRWDRAGAWTIAYGTQSQVRHNTGYCDTEDKVIYLDPCTFPQMSNDGQLAFIIHEICHDVAAAFHNRRWANRMELAAKRAAQLNELEIAEILRSDIYAYFGNGLALAYNAAGVTTYVQDVLRRDTDVSLESLIRRTAKFFGYRHSKVSRDFGDLMQRVAWHVVDG